MLKKIEIENSSGISEKVEMVFTKQGYGYRNEYIYNEIVSPAVLYGKNSSGKTSILKSINNIIKIFSGDIMDNDYYAMKNIFTNSNETKISLQFELEGTDYEYNVIIENQNEIIFEELKIENFPKYKREKNRLGLADSSEACDSKLSEYVRDIDFSSKVSFLRFIGREGIDDEISRVYEYFRTFKFIATNKNISSISTNMSRNDLLVKYNEQYSKYIKEFPHIMNLKFKIEKEISGERIVAIYTKNNKEYELDFETMISSGTKDFYTILSLILSMEKGSLLVIDEIEKTFHPELLDVLVKMLSRNFDVQIICASHNTHLLQSLRPDQIYLIKKEEDIVKAERLSETNPNIREIHNIEKLYFGGRFE